LTELPYLIVTTHNGDGTPQNYVHGITYQETVILNLSQLLEFSMEVW